MADRKFKNIILLLFSVFFYAWGAPRFIFVILGTTILDFVFVSLMDRSQNKRGKILLLILSLSMNVGLLFYFKYCNFFVDNLNLLKVWLGLPAIQIAKIVLPIGISFYTFESITYVVDVYRGVHKPLKNFWDYQLYIIFFPKLIAGPIVRYHDIADQITNRFEKETIDDKLIGFNRFIIGLSKKVIIANLLGWQADQIINVDTYNGLSASMAWFAALCYTMQIYFDFSGYSDMAIGIARMLSFRLPENFERPYLSTSITDFWKRWHITLGSWMRNYLYIPLGGNRSDKVWRTYLNLWVVFLLSGLWHGASWTFILWGAYHGFWLVFERAFWTKIARKLPSFINIALSFMIVLVGWVLFRIEDITKAKVFLMKMFSFNTGQPLPIQSSVIWTLLLAVFISFSAYFKPFKQFANFWYEKETLTAWQAVWLTLASVLLFLICIARVVGSDFNPFIYFRF